jgi:hypothetical protein
MSFVIAAPEMMTAAASDLTTIGETLNAAHNTAAAPTVAVLPAAADEVSAGIAHLFSGYAENYQKLAGEAAASYQQFVQQLTRSAGAYASAEAANTALLRPLTATAGSIGTANAAVGQLTSEQFDQLYGPLVFIGFFAGLILVFGIPFAIAIALEPILYPIFQVLGPIIDATLQAVGW